MPVKSILLVLPNRQSTWTELVQKERPNLGKAGGQINFLSALFWLINQLTYHPFSER